MVHSAGEVLVEDERYAGDIAKAAIGEADAVGLDELRRRGLVIVRVIDSPSRRLEPPPKQDQLALCPPSTLRT
jgi:hypothetical protein